MWSPTPSPDAAGIAAALRELIGDPARRAAPSQAALRRSRRFTRAASAEAHLRSCRRAVGLPE
ncbi:hypothetical protein [uncultured Thermomonospora sp.]|uniref:hypothetical protein n=1 Tax=uncultured Thermomonospora sp. TaxID=671175 RepID=UPI00259B29F2|nr:hypothetical protein [uncultured Thermomonospora sp.]